jgi:pentatricopeptide repeat protein
MQIKSIVPDSHTFIGVFRACAKLGDTQTAYDALQDMKIHGIPMTDHTYNGLIRTYAGAASVRFVKEEHVDMYIKDSMDLIEQIKKDDNVEINIHILNSLVLLHSNALRVDDLDANVLPLYTKHKIKHDIFTY